MLTCLPFRSLSRVKHLRLPIPPRADWKESLAPLAGGLSPLVFIE